MDLTTILLIAIAVAINTCIIAITKGMVIKSTMKRALIISPIFSGFQVIIFLIGWIFGVLLQTFISTSASWIAFILISIIGIKMIYESIFGNERDEDVFGVKQIIFLALATIPNAFVVGISFGLLNTSILQVSFTIGAVTLILSLTSFYIGKQVRYVFGKEIRILGGLLLIGIGLFNLISQSLL
ncbi:MAG: manganese efflux pump MntP [Methanobacterium sp.]